MINMHGKAKFTEYHKTIWDVTMTEDITHVLRFREPIQILIHPCHAERKGVLRMVCLAMAY